MSAHVIRVAPPTVALAATIRDRRARLWLVIVDAWTRAVLADADCAAAHGPALRRLARLLDATVDRAHVVASALDTERALAWRDALHLDGVVTAPRSAAAVLWCAVATWDDAADEQRRRHERGGVPWERYARAAEVVVEAIDDAAGTSTARAADALRSRMEQVEARLWGRAVSS
jgi:hypothetical protein